jgi:hypothetical protein
MAYIGNQIRQYSDRVVLDSLTASATANYTLQLNGSNYVPSSAESLTVSLNGVIQKPQNSYTVSGSTLSFASALTASDSIDFVIAERGITLQTPSAGSVNTEQLASNAVTPAKLNLNDNLLFNTASKGIYLGTTTATASNLLDDYEEGTFTPTIAGTTTAGTGTYSDQHGQYTKVGDICFVNIYIVWNAHTGTGNMKLSNLPFTSIAGTPPGSGYQAVIPHTGNISFTGNIEMQLNPSSTDLFYYQNNNGSVTSITLDTNAFTVATFVYKTA